MAVLNNYVEYSLDDNHTVNLFYAAWSIKCCVTFCDEQEVKVKL